jgi:hypothetical protein
MYTKAAVDKKGHRLGGRERLLFPFFYSSLQMLRRPVEAGRYIRAERKKF